MSVNPLKWKARNLVYFVLGLLILYTLFIYKRTHRVTFEATIKDTKPEAIWEFVADFSNMKKLNPTIEGFSVLGESGNFDHWKYSVEYTERLSHVPMIRNTAQGHYSIKQEGGDFLISSEHKTCFSTSFICVDSVSEFRFRGIGKDTKCQEIVQYECPVVFSMLCRKEVMFQRREIMSGLEKHFAEENTAGDND